MFAPFSYPHYDLKKANWNFFAPFNENKEWTSKVVAFILKTRDFFFQVALEMVVLSNFEDKDDLRFLPKLKQSTKPTPLSSIIPSTQNFALGFSYLNCSIVVSRP